MIAVGTAVFRRIIVFGWMGHERGGFSLKTRLSSSLEIPLAKPVFDEEMKKAAVEALLNERFVLGESVYKFEEEFARYCNVDFAVSTSSGTNALQIAFVALGIKPGDRVITTSASFVATSNAVLHARGEPDFADIALTTYTIDPGRIRRAVGPKTRGVVPVHLYGYPADMDAVNEVAEKEGLFVVEDACQAHGAIYKGRKVGGLSSAACFSFYSSKNMTVAGDGGMLVTDDKKVAEDSKKLRDCGRVSQYVHDVVGYTSRLNTVNAAIGRVQLKRLDEWNEKRVRNAGEYDRLLSDVEGLSLPPSGDGRTKPVYHLYVVRTSRRDDLEKWLRSNGIHCGIHYSLPIHLQPVYKGMYGFTEGMLPKSEELCRTCLSLPMYPSLGSEEIEFVSERIHEFFGSR